MVLDSWVDVEYLLLFKLITNYIISNIYKKICNFNYFHLKVFIWIEN